MPHPTSRLSDGRQLLALFHAAMAAPIPQRDIGLSREPLRLCRCNDLLRDNRASEVASLFCALDKVCAEVLEEQRHGVRFERPTALANGDDARRFRFHERDPA